MLNKYAQDLGYESDDIYNEESINSEIYAISQFLKEIGISPSPKNIIATEKEMSRWQCPKPEIIIKINDFNVSIEVKRIFSVKCFVERPSYKLNKKRVKDSWHWHSTIKRGLEKVTESFLDNARLNGIKVDKHILLIILPLSLERNDVLRIVRRSISVFENDFDPIINTKMYFVFGPDMLFEDLS